MKTVIDDNDNSREIIDGAKKWQIATYKVLNLIGF